MAAVEMMVPDDIENHLILNKHRLATFDAMWQEVTTILEARTGIKLKEPSRPSSAFIPYSGGKYKNVGGPRGDGGLWDDEEVEVVPPPRPPRPRTPAKALAKSPSRPKVTPVKK